jgi:hypothetical protein
MMYVFAILFALLNVYVCSEVRIKLIQSIDESLGGSTHTKPVKQSNLLARKFTNVSGLRWHQAIASSFMDEEAWYALNVDKSFKSSLSAVRSVLASSSVRSGTSALDQYQVPRGFCPYEKYRTLCDHSYPYRMIDGGCNNLENPRWGMSKSPFKRLLHSAYEDSVNEPRSGSYSRNRSLPNPRLVAMRVHSSADTSSDFSHILPHFNDFIHHVWEIGMIMFFFFVFSVLN